MCQGADLELLDTELAGPQTDSLEQLAPDAAAPTIRLDVGIRDHGGRLRLENVMRPGDAPRHEAHDPAPVVGHDHAMRIRVAVNPV